MAKFKKSPKPSKPKTVTPVSKSPDKEDKSGKGSKPEDAFKQLQGQLPKELQEKLEQIKAKIDKFKEQVLQKFGKYIVAIALLPPPKPKEGEEGKPPEKIHLLVLVDDSDSKTMTKEELQDKLSMIISKMAEEVDQSLQVQTMILSELWQNCYDGKYDIVKLIAMSAPVHDEGLIEALKVSMVHQDMVLKKFDKYIVSYVISGSIMYGKYKPDSDIDVYVLVDDTDVKRMTRAELKDKLRAMIISMGFQAKEMTGCTREFHIQVYILTDWWESLRESHPVIVDFLRNGVPLYDKGLYVAWKQLLITGRIKPSQEAIDMFKSSGEQIMKRINWKLTEILFDDIFLATLTPMQAALMSYGVSPPAPKMTPDLVREVFVKKEKLLEPEYADILEEIITIHKDIEHNVKKEVKGVEVDEMVVKANKFLKRLDKLFEDIAERKEIQEMEHISDSTVSIIRDILRIEGVEKIKDIDEMKAFERELVRTGKIPEKMLRTLKMIIKGYEDYKAGKLTRNEIQKIKRDFNEFMKFMVEYLQRRRGQELEKARIRVKHGEKFGEVILLGKIAFIIHDLDAEEKTISKADITANGGLENIRPATIEELEKELARQEIPEKVFIKDQIFVDLKEIFGRDVEVLINYY